MEEYLKNYGCFTLTQKPLNEVDALILCQLSYLRFDGVVPGLEAGKTSVKLTNITVAEKESLLSHIFFEAENRQLLEAVLSAKRYADLKLNCYVNLVKKELETQFAAITYIFPDGTVFIAFRGTDESFVGWKEDFNMSFLWPVPGQRFSVKYLHMVTQRFSGKFYLGGHSKGGNLAVYSAMHCHKKVRQRILRIYNMDGPGFLPETYEQGAYESIADRVVKILPGASLVGMLFERGSNYRVIQSGSFGVAQHNAFRWKIEKDHFVERCGLTSGTQRRDCRLNAFILSMDKGRRKRLVEALYRSLSATGADNFLDCSFWKKPYKLLPEMLKALHCSIKKKGQKGRGR